MCRQLELVYSAEILPNNKPKKADRIKLPLWPNLGKLRVSKLMERASFVRRLCPRLTRSSASRVSWHNWPAGPQTRMTLTSLWPKESNGGTTESKWNRMTTSWTQNTSYPTTSNQVWVFMWVSKKQVCASIVSEEKTLQGWRHIHLH